MAKEVTALPNPRRRHLANLVFFRVGSMITLALVVGPVAWLIVKVVADAVPHWKWSVLTTTTQGTTGGLENAVLGTLLLLLGVLVIAGVVGVAGGIYLAELVGRRPNGKPRGGVLRTATEVLSGIPSIVLGYVGFTALVVGLHWQLSLLPAWIVLSVMVVPYIARGTETALRQVPTAYREGAEALGMPFGHGLRKVVLRSAIPGIVTSLLIALAISAGETAPLLYTAGWSVDNPSFSLLHKQVGYLTYPVWGFWDYPSKQANYLSFDAALLLVALVLVLLVTARIIVAGTQRHAESRR